MKLLRTLFLLALVVGQGKGIENGLPTTLTLLFLPAYPVVTFAHSDQFSTIKHQCRGMSLYLGDADVDR